MHKESGSRTPNLSLVYLAGYLLEHGHEVEVLDLALTGGHEQERFLKKEFDLLGITATSFSFTVCREAGLAIRELSPGNPKIVVGGPHVSVAREEVLTEPWIDYAIYGEGELPLLALVELLQEHPSPTAAELRGVSALIFRDGEEAVVNSPPERISDLDSLPLPAYQIFPMDKYDYHALSTSRGCPYSCAYCASAAILGRKWVARSPERIVEEIEYTIKRWGKKPFHVVDDTFNLKEDRVKELCRLLLDKKLGIEWNPCGIRADRTDPEMLKLMKQSGCDTVCVGIESANPQVLKNIGKKVTREKLEIGIKRLRKAGIAVVGMFMIGNPGDTAETVKESLEFAKSLPLNTVRFYIAIPFPNTKLWDFVEEHGTFLREDYENYHDYSEEPLFETPEFSREERLAAYEEAKTVMFAKPKIGPGWLADKATQFYWVSKRDGVSTALGKVGKKLAKKVRARHETADEENASSADGDGIKTRFSRQ